MNTKLTIFLILANLIVFYLIVDLSNTKQISVQTALMPVNVSKLDIYVKQIDEKKSLEMKKGKWFLTEPVSWEAEFYSVQRIINQIASLSAEPSFSVSQAISSGKNLNDFGLENPDYSIKWQDDKGVLSQIKIGVNEKLKTIYALSPDEKDIIILQKVLLEEILKDLSNLMSTKIFDILPNEVVEVFIRRSSDEEVRTILLIERNLSNDWSIKDGDDADDGLSEKLVNHLIGLRVKKFMQSKDLLSIKTGLLPQDNPLRITLEGHSQNRQTLVVGSIDIREGGRFAYLESSPEIIFTIDEDISGDNAKVDDMQSRIRNKYILPFETSNVQKISLQNKNENIALEVLDDGLWQIVSQNARMPADMIFVQNLLAKLSILKTNSFISDLPSQADLDLFGLGQDCKTKITLEFKDQVKKELLIGNKIENTNNFYAKLGDKKFVYSLSGDIFALLNNLDFRDRKILDIPKSSFIKEVEILNLKTDKTIILNDKNSPEQSAIIKDLKFIRAKRFLDNTNDISIENLDKIFDYKMTISIQNKDASTEIAVDKKNIYLKFNKKLNELEANYNNENFIMPSVLKNYLYDFISKNFPSKKLEIKPLKSLDFAKEIDSNNK